MVSLEHMSGAVVLHILSPSARSGVLADEARRVAIAPQCICDLLHKLLFSNHHQILQSPQYK